MYTAFYGLREKPFALTPDPRFLFLAHSHREALAHLLYGVDQGEGFIAITGEVGTGKTTLCRKLLERLGSDCELAYLFNPSCSDIELLEAIAAEFGLEASGRSRSELGAQLNRFLLEKNAEKRRVLLLIDEAQNLSIETLEQVRLLSNLETSNSKLIQILLLGQPELDRKLDSRELRQLRQRIGVRWGLQPLSRRETRDYVRHRLRVAAGAERDIFSKAALKEIHRRSSGIPRLVNVVCDRSLLAGYAAGKPRVGPALVKEAAREVSHPRLRSGRSRPPLHRRRPFQLAAAALLFGLATVGLVISVGDPSALYRALLPGDWLDETRAFDTAGSVATAPPPLAWRVEVDAGTSQAAAAAGAPDPADPPPLEVAGVLALILDDVDAAGTCLAAVNAVLEAFGLPLYGRAPESDGVAAEMLQARGLTVLPLEDADFEILRTLNHPALLPLRSQLGETRLLALRHLDGDRALLYGSAESSPLSLPWEEVDERWNGQALVVWQDFESLPPVLALGERGSAVAWLQSALAELGYYRGETSGVFDSTTRDGLRLFQQSRDLRPDGAAGPRTQMVLYDVLERYQVPRLRDRGETG